MKQKCWGIINAKNGRIMGTRPRPSDGPGNPALWITREETARHLSDYNVKVKVVPIVIMTKEKKRG